LHRSFPGPGSPTLVEVAERVEELRRSKGMLLEGVPGDLRSAGSFFTNPILDRDERERLHETLREAGVDAEGLPEWSVDADHVKCSAAWLIEASGMHRGLRRGPVGLSPHHVLALVNHGGATAAELLGLAFEVRDRVLERTGVRLVPEPVPLGFEAHELGDLWAK
jgi:UDP-N-acetylmuramate dehydrogenase